MGDSLQNPTTEVPVNLNEGVDLSSQTNIAPSAELASQVLEAAVTPDPEKRTPDQFTDRLLEANPEAIKRYFGEINSVVSYAITEIDKLDEESDAYEQDLETVIEKIQRNSLHSGLTNEMLIEIVRDKLNLQDNAKAEIQSMRTKLQEDEVEEDLQAKLGALYFSKLTNGTLPQGRVTLMMSRRNVALKLIVENMQDLEILNGSPVIYEGENVLQGLAFEHPSSFDETQTVPVIVINGIGNSSQQERVETHEETHIINKITAKVINPENFNQEKKQKFENSLKLIEQGENIDPELFREIGMPVLLENIKDEILAQYSENIYNESEITSIVSQLGISLKHLGNESAYDFIREYFPQLLKLPEVQREKIFEIIDNYKQNIARGGELSIKVRNGLTELINEGRENPEQLRILELLLQSTPVNRWKEVLEHVYINPWEKFDQQLLVRFGIRYGNTEGVKLRRRAND